MNLDALLDAAVTAARACGDIVHAAFGSAAPISAKGLPGDWVTETDTSSERTARALLTGAFPEIPVFGEEEGGERGSLGWFVDPLDGTANFVHRFPVVGVSIALVRDGVPIVGVVHAPMLGDTFTATEGGGAHQNGKPITVSSRPVAQAICATGFPFRHNERLGEYQPVLEHALVDLEDLRRAGAASLDLAWSAAGVFDGYFELALGPWDVAAGALLVREAGGVVTDWSGDDTAWLTSGDIVAAPPAVHEHLLALIAGVRRA